ncbi:MAG: DUF4388 domain-containing protein [Gemmatimonadaceae bacterium]|nr:DUF4388 domain-containing protein [Gemmatimonadaceae bacterium]
MAIEGPLRELGIHDVFQLLDLSRKTGRLRVSSALRDNEGTVYFRVGRIVAATIRSNPHPLGALLLRSGRITEADLARARAVQEAPGEDRRLGEILVAQHVVSVRELERAIMRQVETVVFELLSWQEGFFSFAEEDVQAPAGAEGMVALPTESLLMEGARRLDEWTQIQQRIPSLAVIPVLAEAEEGIAPSRLDLLPHEWEVLSLVDGVQDLRAIARTLERSEFEVARIAFGLATIAVIDVLAPTDATEPDRSGEHLATCLAEARDALLAERLDDALARAATAVSLAPQDPEARSTLARVLLRQGREAEAAEELRIALEADAAHAGALMERARLAARHGELARAIESWQRVLAACPESPLGEQARHAIAHASQLAAVLEAVDA